MEKAEKSKKSEKADKAEKAKNKELFISEREKGIANLNALLGTGELDDDAKKEARKQKKRLQTSIAKTRRQTV